MHFPSTPSSSNARIPTTPVPNAPYMSPRDLPPSPVTPTHPLSGHGAVPYMHPGAHPSASAHRLSYGLMTPPTTPERARGGGAVRVNPVVAPQLLYFNVALPYDRVAVRPPYSMRHIADRLVMDAAPTSVVVVNIIDVFRFEVRARRGGEITIEDFLSGTLHAMVQPALAHEMGCFPREVRERAVQYNRAPRRVDFLGNRVLFTALDVTRASNGVVYCDLQLAVTSH